MCTGCLLYTSYRDGRRDDGLREGGALSRTVAAESFRTRRAAPVSDTHLDVYKRQLNDPSKNIITLEDPVEFTIAGLTQIPVSYTHLDVYKRQVTSFTLVWIKILASPRERNIKPVTSFKLVWIKMPNT